MGRRLSHKTRADMYLYCAKICSNDKWPLSEQFLGTVYMSVIIQAPINLFPELKLFKVMPKDKLPASTLDLDEMKSIFLFCYHMATDKIPNYYGTYRKLTETNGQCGIAWALKNK